MAFITDFRAFEASVIERATAMIRAAAERSAQRRVYRQTLSELRNLSKRELDDMGIHHSMIREIAREAAYGK